MCVCVHACVRVCVAGVGFCSGICGFLAYLSTEFCSF